MGRYKELVYKLAQVAKENEEVDKYYAKADVHKGKVYARRKASIYSRKSDIERKLKQLGKIHNIIKCTFRIAGQRKRKLYLTGVTEEDAVFIINGTSSLATDITTKLILPGISSIIE